MKLRQITSIMAASALAQVGQPSYYGDPDANTDFSQQYQVDYVRVWGS